MIAWTFRFYGKTIGAIGVSSEHAVTVRANTHDAALLKLYDTHDHIMSARLIRKESV